MEILSIIEVEQKNKRKPAKTVATHAIVNDGTKIRTVRIVSNWTLIKLWYSGLLEKNK
jgi:hypothetical protein